MKTNKEIRDEYFKEEYDKFIGAITDREAHTKHASDFFLSQRIADLDAQIEHLKRKKTDERFSAQFGEWFAGTYREKMLVNAVLDDQITYLESLKKTNE